MRVILHALMALAFAAGTSVAQDKKPPKTITLTGCVQRDEKTPDLFTLTDKITARTYRLTGADFREHIGRRVQVDGGVVGGGVVKGVRISGGLQPNANVAAQAAMDPSEAAVASAPGIGPTGTIGLSDFHVKTIRSSSGTCP
jgi:hypothetical protein